MEFINNLTTALSNQFGNVLPGVLGAIVILIIGFSLAWLIKLVIKKLLKRTSIDEKIGAKLNTTFRVDEFVAKLVYYIIIIYTLLVVLNLLGANSVLAPLETMMSDIFGYIPNVLLAGIIGYAGYMIASLFSEAGGFITNGIEQFTTKNGINTGSINVAKIVKQLIFIVIFIPMLILALDTLNMDAISQPASEMLNTFMSAIPKILAAAILIAVFYIAGKYIVGLAVELLKSLGLDNLSKEIGISSLMSEKSLSVIVGKIAMFFIIFTGIIAAFDKLDLPEVSNILNNIFVISGKIFFGMIIMLCGSYISKIATNAFAKEKDSKWLAQIIRFATMGLFLAFALHTMGIATEIVELAFGLTLGAIAVAFALAFGLGGREAAGKQLDHFFNKLRK